MSAEIVHGTPWAQEFIDEGRAAGLIEGREEGLAEGQLRSARQVLLKRGVTPEKADLIAEKLLAEDESTAVSRAAFDELEQLTALAR